MFTFKKLVSRLQSRYSGKVLMTHCLNWTDWICNLSLNSHTLNYRTNLTPTVTTIAINETNKKKVNLFKSNQTNEKQFVWLFFFSPVVQRYFLFGLVLGNWSKLLWTKFYHPLRLWIVRFLFPYSNRSGFVARNPKIIII